MFHPDGSAGTISDFGRRGWTWCT